MEYGRLQPLKGNSASEPTAFTKKTIKELLAEEGVDASEAQLTREPAPKPAVPQPPHMQGADAVKAAFQPLAEPETMVTDKPRSLLGRLLGR